MADAESAVAAPMKRTPLDPASGDPFGPHAAYSSGARLDTGVEPDKVVKTHCCFCGQQCGIQLKVKDNVVIGFEPWTDFPFNQGMLCPKGVKRYLQGGHPDRLLTAMRRDSSSPCGARPPRYTNRPTCADRAASANRPAFSRSVRSKPLVPSAWIR